MANGAGELLTLLGADAHHGVDIGPALEVFGSPERSSEAPPACPVDGLRGPVWDSFTASLYMLYGNAVVRVDNCNYVTQIAGHMQEAGCENGPGVAARFLSPSLLVSDGSGSLYVADSRRIRRIQLSAAWRAEAALPAAQSPARPAAGPPALRLCPTSPRDDPEAFVSTLAFEALSDICGLAYVPGHRGVVSRAASSTAAAINSSSTPSTSSGTSSARGLGGAVHGSATLGLGPNPSPRTTTPRTAPTAAPSAASGCGAVGGSLLFATSTAVYRLSLGHPPAEPHSNPIGANSTPRGGGGSRSHGHSSHNAIATLATPELLAGREGERSAADGPGADARFRDICGLAVDRDGSGFAIDYAVGQDVSAVRRVAADGTVATVADGLKNRLVRPAILPNGYLALCDHWSDGLQLLDLGLKPQPAATAGSGGAGGGASCRTLAADLGSLLERQPDGTSDLTVLVGGHAFAVHRGILAARCEYFRRRLLPPGGGAGAAGGACSFAASIGLAPAPPPPQPPLRLPDTDPEAFALVLRFIYTGRVSIPVALAPAVSELADRLALPELCREAQAQLLAEMRPETVVATMLWAEARGPRFAQLLADLKAWYLEHHEEVVARAPNSIKRLMQERSDLVMELHFTYKRARGR